MDMGNQDLGKQSKAIASRLKELHMELHQELRERVDLPDLDLFGAMARIDLNFARLFALIYEVSGLYREVAGAKDPQRILLSLERILQIVLDFIQKVEARLEAEASKEDGDANAKEQ